MHRHILHCAHLSSLGSLVKQMNNFEELCDFVKEIKFDNMGVFTTQEEGTPAGAREDQVPEEVKEERYHILMSIQAAISEENNRDLEGTH